MHIYLRKKFLKIFFSIIAFSFLCSSWMVFLDFKYGMQDKITLLTTEVPSTLASAGDSLYGWIWNDMIGWISLNSLNCDADGDGWSDDIGYCPPATEPVEPYGVHIDEFGEFFGHAYSETIGYISFNCEDSGTCASPYSVNVDLISGEITGWARICSLADNPATCSGTNGLGWIKMAADAPNDYSNVDISNYGVLMNTGSNEFSGYAWSDYMGWISFSCVDGGTGQVNICATSDYGATNNPALSYGVTNVEGWAWSDVIGWISFNCGGLDSVEVCDSSSSNAGETCTNNGQCTGGSCVAACEYQEYGVGISTTTATFGIVNGYAWNEQVGWISFQETDPPDTTEDGDLLPDYPGLVTGKCVDETLAATELGQLCDGAEDHCTACYNIHDNTIYGWAKILSQGDDGWIRLDNVNWGTGFDGLDVINWGWNASDLDGGAASYDTGIGWISMNCKNEVCVNTINNMSTDSFSCIGVDTCSAQANHECRNQCRTCDDNGEIYCTSDAQCTGSCVGNNYHVFANVNVAPIASTLTAPNWPDSEACPFDTLENDGSGTGQARGAFLEWEFIDPNIATASYRLILREYPSGTEIIDTGRCDGLGNCMDDCNPNNNDGSLCRINPNCSGGNCSFPLYESDLDYNQSYTWSVQLWDGYGLDSGVVAFNQSIASHQLVDGADDSVDTTFTTYTNEFPLPVFKWFTPNPSLEEEVKMISTTSARCYQYTSPTTNTEIDCNTSSTWDWDVDTSVTDYSSATIEVDDSYSASTTLFKYTTQSGIMTAILELTDHSGYSCSTSTSNDEINLRLPSWIEAN